ncbi:transposon Tf2-9 polyprotein [Trichonephila clavipes]|nr:transposon Tf2-9 polyprotein [Trichonephila clavipes]
MIKDKFPLPLIEEALDKLEQSKVYTSLDLKNGLFHVPMDLNSTKYTSFVTHEGQYEFLHVPFRLSNSPSVFQRFIYTVLRKFIRDNILIVYMDETERERDLLVPSQNEAEGNPVLHVFQQGYPLELHTDASSLGFGAVLLKKSDDGLFHPIHYFSRKTTVQQEKYSSYELEVLAIIEALKKFRSYLLGTKFKIIRDCDAFQKTMHRTYLPAKIARWALMLEEFDYEVCHRSGRQMKHVDALSRYPIMMVSSHDITQD